MAEEVGALQYSCRACCIALLGSSAFDVVACRYFAVEVAIDCCHSSTGRLAPPTQPSSAAASFLQHLPEQASHQATAVRLALRSVSFAAVLSTHGLVAGAVVRYSSNLPAPMPATGAGFLAC